MLEQRIKQKLHHRKKNGLYRQPPQISRREGKYIFIGNRKVLNFSSNDYLGLGILPTLAKKVADNFLKFQSSSSSSRLVSGNYAVIAEAEDAYARYFGYESALFFPSGYQANFALISTLFEKGDTLFFDKHIHASSVKGMTASGAQFFGYNHNSMSHLKRRLEKKQQGISTVLTESLFSMDGDFLNVDELLQLKQHHHFFCIVDEAHSFGAVGEGGRGIAKPVADVAVGTFGKTLGLFGAFILLPQNIKEYLFNFASPLIYTTTLPEAQAASALDVLQILSDSDQQRKHLRHISDYMKEQLTQEGFRVAGDAHIIALQIGEEDLASSLSKKLMDENIFAFASRFPTVPAGQAILRVGMTALHTEEDVQYFINTLKKVLQESKLELQKKEKVYAEEPA